MIVSNGNRKIGNDTLILNMCSSTECPSRQLGLCKVQDKCYAMKAERCYPQVLPYRRRQQYYWNMLDIDTLYKMFIAPCIKDSIKYLRFSEAGDFSTQEDVDKMSSLANILAERGIRVYGYTARNDLNFSGVSTNMVVNGSGFLVHNSFTARKEPRGIVCPGNCRTCNICKERVGAAIEVKIH